MAHSQAGITICQRRYCLELLTDSGLLGSKPVSTPTECSVHLRRDGTSPLSDAASYRRLVGRLLYLNSTRPDICFATQQLSQFMAAPTTAHLRAAHRVLRYLKASPGRGLLFRRGSDHQLLGFSDADWAGCPDSRRSVSGFCFFLGDSLVSWRTKKQTTVSRSSSEAEYRALAAATCELQWLTFLLRDMRVQCSRTPVLYCDNRSTLHIASNPIFHERTKHLEIDCHVVREKMQSGLMRLLPISSDLQVADVFTKGFTVASMRVFLPKLGMVDIYHPPVCGGLMKEEGSREESHTTEQREA